jgi:N-acetylglucosaminyl-diphospho-decaprenol L-rhamnosyltransferase
MISIIVISYNTREILAECLRRLELHYPQAELIVVDAGSSDGSPEMVGQDFPKVRLRQTQNQGYAWAVNRGLEWATGEWLVQMNSDVYLEAGDLEALQDALVSNPKAAFAGPTLVNSKGKYQSFGLFDLYRWGLRGPRAVGWISGAIMMLRREAYRAIGGMDERLFFYNEEVEWCWRAQRRGWQSLLVPRRVLHLGGSSTPSDPRFIAEGVRGGLLLTRDYLFWLHGLHRKAIWLEAILRLRFDPNPKHQAAYRMIREMVEAGKLEQSPFRSAHPT